MLDISSIAKYKDFFILCGKKSRNLRKHALSDDEIEDVCNNITSINLSQFAAETAKRVNIRISNGKQDLLIYPKLADIPDQLLLILYEDKKASRIKPKLKVDLGPNKSAKLFMKL